MPLLIAVLAALVDLAIRIAAIIVIPRNRKPTAAMAWLLAIFLIPFVGILFFLLLGSSKLPKKRMEKQAEINRSIADSVAGMDLTDGRTEWPDWFASVVTLNTGLGAVPLVGGNTAHLIGDYRASIAAMTAEIDAATTFVHVQYYIVSLDDTTKDFFAAMEAAVKRGVTVRLLADHIASIRTVGHAATFAELDRIGVMWSFMLPVQPFKGKYQRPDLRNHRKIVVVDGRVGFMGSQNLIDRSYLSAKNLKRGLQWQELVVRVTGPAVSGMNAVFLSDWYSETDEKLLDERVPAAAVPRDTSPEALECQVVPSGPGFEGENNLRLFLASLYTAQKRIIITSPYFVPDEAMMYAITSSCQRGLEVQLFVSEIGDQGPVYHAQRSYYGALLQAGVRIWLYPAPYILHAKHLSIDEDVAVIGSSNMDIRSFSLDLEVSLLVRGASFVAQMREVEEGYRTLSRELTLADWNREPGRATALDGLARLTSALQ
ncbi:cardiolipin synthase [Cryobacterium sp. TMT1-21]|uniref:cardiolipin synthase n=1 Tax=unclassified Cryobacterium TaxID=2649013 RepID=UPI00106C4F58|nr:MULTISPECIES: cardiolipin synthase [unclassified Cryobacterium]TFD14565.1 cardiolipin synthase [Cryobacterium sp. TMT4-10]TFD15748.1 cardiolipin synthase [Cryobacterium sp. TMT1-21]TFD39441.1 cardiolipin synthase [Cryobacterium sp. TMT2-10]